MKAIVFKKHGSPDVLKYTDFEIDSRYIFAKHISIIGSTMGTLKDFKEVMSLIVVGKLCPVVDKTFALKDARLAHERLEANQQLGKITLNIG